MKQRWRVFRYRDLRFSFEFDQLFVGIQEPDLLSNCSGDGDHGELISSSLEIDNNPDEKTSVIASEKHEDVVKNHSLPNKTLEKPQSKNFHGKRKLKIDWTPELHRRFVQAVEELGVDKAVPSKILELMGIHCLTRHNIASHLQKYRSHRKHLVAKEAEASINYKEQQWQEYGGVPIMGFPALHVIRPLHVWGHPLPALPPYYRHFPSQPYRGYCSGIQVGGLAPRSTMYASHPQIDPQPSKESIDAAIGDAISKPWLPLPLGLNPPSTDSVLRELQRHANQTL